MKLRLSVLLGVPVWLPVLLAVCERVPSGVPWLELLCVVVTVEVAVSVAERELLTVISGVPV